MPSRPARPTTVTVIYAAEEDGHLQLWAEVAGKELHFIFHRNAIPNRKLDYGYASRRVVERSNLGRPIRVESIDRFPDANDRAIAALFAEHLDRYEAHDDDWTQYATGPRPDQPGGVAGLTRRPDLEKTYVVPRQAPPVDRRMVR